MNFLKKYLNKSNFLVIASFIFLSFFFLIGSNIDTSKVSYADAEVGVSYTLNGIVVNNLENHLVAQYGIDFSVEFTLDEGYVEFIEDSVAVTIGGTDYTGYTFDGYTGVLTITGADIIGDIEISAQATETPTVYAVTASSTGATFNNITSINKYETFSIQFTPDKGKILYPAPYVLTINGESILENTEMYTVDRYLGEIIIPAQYVTGDIEVTWNAQNLTVKSFLTKASIEDSPVEITLNQELSFKIIPNQYYNLPTSIELKLATNDGEIIDPNNYSYDSTTGIVTIPENIVTDVICVSGTAVIKQANVTYTLTNATYAAYQTYSTDVTNYLATWYVNILADENYRLDKSSIIVKIGGEVAPLGEAYEVATSSDRIWIKSGFIVGDIEIIAEAVSTLVSITYDLKNFEIADAPQSCEYNTALSMMLTYIDDIGYTKPNNKDLTYFMVYADGVAQTDGSSQVGWRLTAAYKLDIYKATTMCQNLHIVAHAAPIEYTISISTDIYGTIKYDSVTYTRDTQEDPLADVIDSIRDGYEFDYWSLTSIADDSSWTGSKYNWQAGNYGNISVKAKYKTNDYVITVLPGDHGSVSASSVSYTSAMTNITMPTVTPEDHYTFSHWEIIVSDGNWETGEFVFTKDKIGNITVVAMYELTQYKINLDVSYGGRLTGPSVLTYTVETETMPELEIPITSPAFAFTGWEITTATGSWTVGPYSWGGLGSYGDIVVTAQYTAQSYTISFVTSSDCTYDMQSITYTAGQAALVLPSVEPNEHFELSYWIVEQSDGSFAIGDEFNYVPGVYGNITLKPILVPTQYTITLHTDSKGTLVSTIYNYTYFTMTSPTLNQPITYNDGYEFSHWEVVDTVGSWTAGETYSWQTNRYGNVILIARYRALETTYTVEIYYQTLDFSDYTLGETFVETGMTWETKTLTPWQEEGFKFNTSHQNNVLTNYLTGDGSEVFKLYFDRNIYTISYDLTNLTEREAIVSGRTYNAYSVVYGAVFYVYLDPADDYHLNLSSIKFKVNGLEESVPYTKAATSNRLYFESMAFAGDLTIIAEGRLNFFSITYELTGVQILDDGNDYSKIEYDTQLQIPLELIGDSSIYSMPTADTVKIYVDDKLITSGFMISSNQGYIQLYKAAAVGEIRIVAAAAYKEYTITVKAAEQFTIKYNYTTEIVLPESTTPGLALTHYTFVSNNYNQQWGTKYPEKTITDFNVGTGLFGNITLTPYYEEIPYTITFIPDEHCDGLTKTENYTVTHTTMPNTPTYTAHPGYRFEKWVIISTSENSGWTIGDYEWESGKYGDITVQAVFVGRDDISYQVKHYFETLSGSYELNNAKTQDLLGITDTEVVAQPLSEIGFSFDSTNVNNQLSGLVNADGTLVLSVYYTRNLYNITIAINHTEYGSLDGNVFENVKFGSPIVIQGNTITIGEEVITAYPNNPTNTQTFEFVAWDISGEVVENDLTIAANFKALTRYYTVVFKNGDIVIKTMSLEYEQVPTFEEEIPTKEGTETLIYTFDGWTINGGGTVYEELPAIVGDTVFVAHFSVEDLPVDDPADDNNPEDNNNPTDDELADDELIDGGPAFDMMKIYISVGGGAVILILIIIISASAKKKKKKKLKFEDSQSTNQKKKDDVEDLKNYCESCGKLLEDCECDWKGQSKQDISQDEMNEKQDEIDKENNETNETNEINEKDETDKKDDNF